MKLIRKAFSALAFGSVASFGAAVAGPPEVAALPPLNAKVAEFARKHRGEPVGDGICVSLAIESLQAAGARDRPALDPDGQPGDYAWGEPVALKDVLPGDILQFRAAEFAGVRTVRGRRETWHDTYPHHTAVVVATAEKGRLITICHQNVVQQGEDASQVGLVREATLRMNSMRSGGYLRAYRPVARSLDGSDGR